MMFLALRVLVLNQTYEPLHFCTGRRALTLVLAGRADIVEASPWGVKSPNQSFVLPAVIRLRRFIRWSNRFRVVFNKKNILKRDEHLCQYCGRNHRELTLDHVIPISRGGIDDWDNVVAACRDCNRTKGNRAPEEVGLKLLKKPRRPHYLFLFLVSDYKNETMADIWQKYLPFNLKESTLH